MLADFRVVIRADTEPSFRMTDYLSTMRTPGAQVCLLFAPAAVPTACDFRLRNPGCS